MKLRYWAALGIAVAAAPVLAQTPFDAESATRAYLATVNGAARAKSDAYFEGGYWLLLWGFLVGVASDYAFLRFGWAAKLSAWAARRTQRKFLASLLFALPYIFGTFVLTLPWAIYTGFVREHQYDLATQSFVPWFGEQLIALVVSAILFALLLGGLLAMVRRTGTAWWAWGTLITVAGLFFFLILSPILVEPLFNTYKPMPESTLQKQILAMARANGVPADNVYVVDASKQTTRISANVAGLMGTTRIALNDNLLNQSTPAQVRSVMGHELGHYVLNHSYTLLGGFGLLFLAGFWVTARVAPALLRRYGPSWGVTDMTDPAVIPVASIVISAFFLLATPVKNTIVRVHEAEADIFGLNVARAPDGFSQAALKLSTYRKLEPTPLEEAVFYDHPSGRSRIAMSMRWKAEHQGEPGIE